MIKILITILYIIITSLGGNQESKQITRSIPMSEYNNQSSSEEKTFFELSRLIRLTEIQIKSHTQKADFLEEYIKTSNPNHEAYPLNLKAIEDHRAKADELEKELEELLRQKDELEKDV